MERAATMSVYVQRIAMHLGLISEQEYWSEESNTLIQRFCIKFYEGY